MTNTAVHVERLCKQYRIAARRNNRNLREAIDNAFKAPFRNAARLLRYQVTCRHAEGDMTFWALKNVSFEVKQGEIFGIIGRNGAGKSTLLKVLSRITEPTAGSAKIYGRTASLLEVGTGFHPELTGRENIFLNGAILGMRKHEIKSKFDEIVAFAEIEDFIDTPVKHYSSGMHVRLAFAVGAHLDPEILVVDEVLAVGDFAFQRKCLGKMDSAARGGRTVLFVTHDLPTVEKLCGRAILLERGSITAEGSTSSVINHYLQLQFPKFVPRISLVDHPNRRTGSHVIMTEARLYVNGLESTASRIGDSLKIALAFRHDVPIPKPHFGISVETLGGKRLTSFPSSTQSPHLLPDTIREGTIICEIPNIHLVPGLYALTFVVRSMQASNRDSHELDHISQAMLFNVEAGTAFGPIDSTRGVFLEEAKWHFEAA
jgi:lipopolysaccharide transport system ATP-binding protein